MAKKNVGKQANLNAKPEGERYRNLTRRDGDGVIYYARTIEGRRVRFSTQETDWERAAVARAGDSACRTSKRRYRERSSPRCWRRCTAIRWRWCSDGQI